MPIHNSQVSHAFSNYADLLDIAGENPFRIRAYRNAVQVISSLPTPLRDLLKQGYDLTQLPGIGKDLAGKITEIVRTGGFVELDRLRCRFGSDITELLHIGGLGPKRVKLLHDRLGISTLKGLEKAARKGQIAGLRGFSEQTEARILQALKAKLRKTSKRFKLSEADEIVKPLVDYLQGAPGVKKVIVGGSYRRRKETVGDLDILASAARKNEVSKYLINYEDVRRQVAKGSTKSTVVLKSGIQVDLRVVPEESFGAALHYFTGSKSHNIAIRTLGVRRGLKINEYGVFRRDKRIAGKTEDEIFSAVGLPYIEPELRENSGEIEAARKGMLPTLIALKDIRGDLQMHSTWSDGRHPIRDMALAAKARGYEYIAMTDHSQSIHVAHGLSPRRLARQLHEIDKLNGTLRGITVLKSAEVDIHENGTLDFPDSLLRELDIVVCSIHSKFSLSRAKQTERIIRAMDNRYVNILGHPTGRIINVREGYEIDFERVCHAAKERRCVLELNAHPDRLDLPDTACRMARDLGVLLAISTDAHNTSDLDFMRYGIGQARRGWLEAKDVINTRSLPALRKQLQR